MALSGDLSSIARLQNGDGGWGYRGGTSWTEPTAYALLAHAASGHLDAAFASGVGWLRRRQRPDGGWPPHPSVGESTWVTALVLLAVGDRLAMADRGRALTWLLAQSGREAGYLHRLRLWLLSSGGGQSRRFAGWPWFPESAGWVTPTALSILALEKLGQRREPEIQRLEDGRRFLLSRMCRDGGWNHGSSMALGRESDSYPETTGLALLALHRLGPSKLTRSLDLAETYLKTCPSADGVAWLQLGLRAHGRTPPLPPEQPPCWTVVDTALCVLARAAAAGRNMFLA